MKKRFTEEPIIGVLKEADAGVKPGKLSCKQALERLEHWEKWMGTTNVRPR